MGFCYQKNFSNPTLPVDEAQFYALVRATQWNENIDRYRETGEASLKRKLPAFIFQATFDETLSKAASKREKSQACLNSAECEQARPKVKAGKSGRWRKQEATRLTGLVVMDIDHVESPQEKFLEWKALDFGALGILLVYITPSGHGLKIVFKADVKKGNLIDNQHAMAEVLGVEVDESCKDASRMSFICKESDILYIDKELFTYENKEFAERYDALYRDGHSQGTREDITSSRLSETHDSSSRLSAAHGEISGDVSTTLDMTGKENVEPITWRGYDVQAIIDARYGDKLPCKADSNRHNESLKLATDLLLMFDGDKTLTQRTVERQPWVQEIIDERDENVAQTVESAAKQLAKREETTSRPYPSKAMQAAIEAVAGMPYRQVVSEGNEGSVTPASKMDVLLDGWGAEIEGLFDDFPMLRDVCSGLKRTQYPAAVFVAGGLMMTLMTRTWYRFYHRPQQERRLNCSLLVIGHPASNKSMADDLYKILASPMVNADKAGKAALNRYKEDSKKKASNKEGKEKPKGLIRIHPARTSNGQLITDMLNAVEVVDGKEMQLHMFTFDTELDNSIQLQKGGSWIDKQTLELKAFHNEEDGQMYANLDSPVDNFNVTWNYIYTGTPLALKKKVNERNFGTGLSTRLAVLPMPKTNFEMIELEDIQATDWERISRMKSWAFKLDNRMGELPMWDIVKRLYQWTKNRMADAQEDQSEANELMLKRVPYHALNYAAPFIDMRHWNNIHQEGKYWTGEYQTDETDWRLCELLANIQYATQQHFFGVMAEKYFDDMNGDVQITGKRHQQKSKDGYSRLPEVFTHDDVASCFGYSNINSTNSKIRRLLEDNQAKKITTGADKGKYQKLNQHLW